MIALRPARTRAELRKLRSEIRVLTISRSMQPQNTERVQAHNRALIIAHDRYEELSK